MGKNNKLPIVILSIIIVACLTTVIIMNKGKKEDVTDISTEAVEDDFSESSFDEESETTENEQNDIESYEDESYDIAYTDNDYPDVNSCLDPDAFEIYYANDFSFGYPKYIFNNAYINESDGVYEFWYDDDYRLTITVNKAEYNAKKSAHLLYEELLPNYSSIYFQREVADLDDKDMCRALVGGHYADSGHSDYNIIASNGEKIYHLNIEYPDSDPKDEYKEINYVVDCVYRYCSFGGGTYQPRTWDQFLVDDMGEKK